MKDNRLYKYSIKSETNRWEYPIILKTISPGNFVIDLGCGDGSLLLRLKEQGVKGIGIDKSSSAVKSARRKGITSIVSDIDRQQNYSDNEFDYAICCVTIQMVMYPEILLSEMRRIAKRQIISIPNFAFLINRLELLLFGRMPTFMLSSFKWYSTGHIHQLSISDLENFFNNFNLKIVSKYYYFPKHLFWLPSPLKKIFNNLLATSAMYVIEK